MGCEEAVICSVKGKKQRTESMLYELADELIPGLPNDVALQCLLRIPVQAHVQLQRVSRKWRELVNSPQYYAERKREATTMHFVCIVQALQKQTSRRNYSLPDLAPAPVFGISVFNVQQRTWERLPHIPEDLDGLPLFCRLVAVNGHLVVLGGWDPATWETLQSVYVYSFSSQSWRRGADMPSTRSSFACGALNGQVFVAGGHDNRKSCLATAEVYNLQEDRWRTLPRMNEERDECTGTVFDGKFYVISGYSTHSQGQFMKSADVYEPARDSWTRSEGNIWAMAERLSSSGVNFAVLSGALYTLDHRSTLVCYSTTKNTWSTVATMPHEPREMSPVFLNAVKDSLVLTGASITSSESNQVLKTFLYKPSSQELQQECCTNGSRSTKCAWEEIGGQSSDFLGVPQFACALEL